MKHHKSLTPPDPIDMKWKVHAAGLIQEIANHSGQPILVRPLQIFAGILHEVGQRASELNDPKLNALMCQLAIYEISDPKSDKYDPDKVREVFRLAREV